MVYRHALFAAIVLRLWLFLDIIFSRFLNLKPLRRDKITTINIQFRRHRGKPVKFDDGSVVNPKDPLIELHLNNAWSRQQNRTINSPTTLTLQLFSAFCEDLKYLAGQLNEGKFVPEIKAIHAITPFHLVFRRLGFTVMELPDTLWKRLSQFYVTGLRRAYYPEGRKLAAGTKPLVLKEVWMAREEFLKKYRP